MGQWERDCSGSVFGCLIRVACWWFADAHEEGSLRQVQFVPVDEDDELFAEMNASVL